MSENTSRVSDILTPDPDVGDGDDVMHCPVCGDNYVHIGEVREFSGADDGVRVACWGECGHDFTVVLNHHKGNTTAYVCEVTETNQLVHTAAGWQRAESA